MPVTSVASVNSYPPVPQPSSPPSAPKTWASLFASSLPPRCSRANPTHAAFHKEAEVVAVGSEIGALLSNYRLSQATVSIQARRLINQGNWCYVNSTLQTLLACPPFYRLLKSLPAFPTLSREKTSTPVLNSMVEFVNEFTELEVTARRWKDLNQGAPFVPSYVYNVLTNMKLSENLYQRGKQGDAEEFLTCLLNKLHEEMGAAITETRKPDAIRNGHHRNGASKASAVSTPISKIFGGLLRSTLSTGGNSKNSVVHEPFFTVPLNVKPTISTVEGALREFVSKETIEGYKCPKTKQKLSAHRRLTFEILPPILTIHLKCFTYDMYGGSQKVIHNTKFKETLVFNKELLSFPKKSPTLELRSYKLFAVVYHSGQRSTGGHYYTDVFHSSVRNWVRFDDNSTKIVETSDMLEFRNSCVPYLLFYMRMDMLQAHSSYTNTGATNNSV